MGNNLRFLIYYEEHCGINKGGSPIEIIDDHFEK